MAIKVPGNPFGVDVQAGSTQEMGLQSAKESEFSARKSWEGIGGTFGKALESFQKDIDETITRDNMLSLNEAVDDILNNEKSGLLRRKGKNALELNNGMTIQEEAQNELKRRYDEIAKGAHNKAQKSALEKFYYNSLTSVQNKLSMHMVEQQAVARKNQRDRENDYAAKSILSNDPERQKSGTLIIRKNIEDAAREAGVEPDYGSVLGEIHALKVSQLITENKPKEAEAWLKEHKDEMSAKQYGTALATVKKGVYENENSEIAKKIWIESKGKGEDALRAVAKVDATRQKDVRKLVQAYLTADEQIAKQERKNIRVATYQYIAQNMGIGKPIELPFDMRQTMLEVDPAALVRVEKLVDTLNSGQSVKTDVHTWEQLYRMAQEQPDQFQKLNLIEHLGELSPADFKFFRKMQDRKFTTQAKSFLGKVGREIDGDKKLREHKAEILAAASRMWDEATENGVIDEKQQQELFKNVFAETSSRGWFGTTTKNWKLVNKNREISPSAALFEREWGIPKAQAEKAMLGLGVKESDLSILSSLPEGAVEEIVDFAESGTFSQSAQREATRWLNAQRGNTGETNRDFVLRSKKLEQMDKHTFNQVVLYVIRNSKKDK